jgi:hypothetical protein
MNEAATLETSVPPADVIWPITQQEISFIRWLDVQPDQSCTRANANAFFRVDWCRLFSFSLIQDRAGVEGQLQLTELGEQVARNCDQSNGSAFWLCVTVQHPHPEAGEEGAV